MANYRGARKGLDHALVYRLAPCSMCGEKRGYPCMRTRLKDVPVVKPHMDRERLVGLLIRAYEKAGEPLEGLPAKSALSR